MLHGGARKPARIGTHPGLSTGACRIQRESASRSQGRRCFARAYKNKTTSQGSAGFCRGLEDGILILPSPVW